jgi:cytochrome P450
MFGYGSRTCIGRNIALFELNKFTVQFLREFDIKYADPEKPYELFSAWFATQENMMVIVTPRSKQL